MNLKAILDSFSGKRIAVIGDAMLDTYVWGRADRISPESPVPVVEVHTREDRLGGAANVALNVKSLGGEALLFSVCGDDDGAARLSKLLSLQGIGSSGLLRSAERTTTEKTRILSRNQQMLRVDSEDASDMVESDEQRLLDALVTELDRGVDMVIFQDYNKGVLTQRVIEDALAACREWQVPAAADPKRKNFFSYQGITIFKPNLRELRDNLPDKAEKEPTENYLRQKSIELHNRLGNEVTLITLSDRGIFYDNQKEHFIVPAYKARQVADVSGAGDTVISVAALCYAAHVDPREMCELANLAAGLVCEKVGVVPITQEALLAASD